MRGKDEGQKTRQHPTFELLDQILGGQDGFPADLTYTHKSIMKVGKYQAFQLTQAVTFSDSPGFSLDLNTLVAVEGTDVFTLVNLSGTNDPVPAGLMLKFINRVKKLR